MWTSLELRPKKHGGSFGFQCIVANGGGGGEGGEPDDNYENPGALPPFLAWEGVLATEIGEPGNTDGGDFYNEAADLEMRSITSSSSAVAFTDFEMVSCATIFFSKLEIASAWARACANCYRITPCTSSLIHAASPEKISVPLYCSASCMELSFSLTVG